MVKTYNPKDHSIIFGGVRITGFADGTFVSVAPTSAVWERVVGADGLVTRVRQNDDTAIVTITLKQSADVNATLSAFLNLDKLSGQGKFPIMIKDGSGTSVFVAPEAWIAEIPEQANSKSVENREWVIHTGNAVFSIGGNN